MKAGNAISLNREVIQVEKHLIKAFEAAYDGYSLDRVLADPKLASALASKCHEFGLPGTPKDWNHLLMRLRKAGKLIDFQTRKRTEFSWAEFDEFSFASEIAWTEMQAHGTLDDILCDPDLAHQFDEVAKRLAPGFTSLQYRWGALKLRKVSKDARDNARDFTALSPDEFGKHERLKSLKNDGDSFNSPGLYLVTGPKQENKYVGSSLNLQKRMLTQFGADQLDHWLNTIGAISIRRLAQPNVTAPRDLLSMQMWLIQLTKPSLNVLGPTAA